MNKTQFARELGDVTDMTVGRWVAGKAEPGYEDKDRIVKLARSKGVKITVAELYADPTDPVDQQIAAKLLEHHRKQLEKSYRKLGEALGLEGPGKKEDES